jgi:N6-adenosine-specific RNA methylase IME4
MEGKHGMIRGAGSFYATMSLQSIKDLPVYKICDENCILFLWATMPLLQNALDVIKEWRFEYKTCGFTWIKKTKNNKIHCGMGHYPYCDGERPLYEIENPEIIGNIQQHKELLKCKQ